MKDLVHNPSCPAKNLSSAYPHSAAAMFRAYESDLPPLICEDEDMTACSLCGSVKVYEPTAEVMAELALCDGAEDLEVWELSLVWRQRRGASVCGRRFTAGEPLSGVSRSGWRNKRCGSLVTTVVDGRSRYALVSHFIEKSDGEGDRYAVVEWLPVPTYPYHPNPLVVFLMDGDPVGVGLSCLLSLEDIEPTGICIERCEVDHGYYVYRMDGLDHIR